MLYPQPCISIILLAATHLIAYITSLTYLERLSMTFIPVPASCAWLQTADPNTVRYEHFLQCCADYIAWQRACGVSEYAITLTPEQYADPGDLQSYVDNVVNWWPKDAPASCHMPSLYQIMTEIVDHHGHGARHMSCVIADHMETVRAWMIGAGKDPSNPNETPEEKAARKNRERVARWRVRHSNTNTDDHTLNALRLAAKRADANAAQGKQWLKGEIQQAKLDMEAAITQSKLERTQRVACAEAAVQEAQEAARRAKQALESYLACK